MSAQDTPQTPEEIIELQKKFSEIKYVVSSALAVMMALSKRSLKQENRGTFAKFFTALRRPGYSEKLAQTVLAKAPLIVSRLQEFTQALNEKVGPEPEVENYGS